jgi:hypothetical protein
MITFFPLLGCGCQRYLSFVAFSEDFLRYLYSLRGDLLSSGMSWAGAAVASVENAIVRTEQRFTVREMLESPTPAEPARSGELTHPRF